VDVARSGKGSRTGGEVYVGVGLCFGRDAGGLAESGGLENFSPTAATTDERSPVLSRLYDREMARIVKTHMIAVSRLLANGAEVDMAAVPVQSVKMMSTRWFQ
jgi:hypothetical protein